MSEWLTHDHDKKVNGLEIRDKKIPKLIVQILRTRGYDTPEKIEKYFAPSLSDLHDPFLLSNMTKAIARIEKAINNKEKVLVHGDYDTDGITGSAIVIKNLRKFGLEVEYHIPNRLSEGYGLSSDGIKHASDTGCSLVITVDCGITGFEEVIQAKKEDIDVIICDHHKPHTNLPDAHAILNPKLPGDHYPFKELAGVGVAFKLMQALYIKLNYRSNEIFEDLDLVALGSVVDVVPLIDENRIFVKYGMKKLEKSLKPGFQAILKDVKLSKEISSYHLGFIIGPRVNACGRMRDAKEALELFLTKDHSRAKVLAQQLSKDNQIRRGIEEKIFEQAMFLIQKKALDKDKIIIVDHEAWHEGVVGIVASRISDTYYCPVIVVSKQGDLAKGSARSIPGVDITETLGQCGDCLIKYGGHSQAAGLELKSENLDELRDCLNAQASKLKQDIFTRTKMYDMKIHLQDLTDQALYFLKFFEPTGMANPQPVFLGENLEVVGIPRVVGHDHLKITLREQNTVFDAIAFSQGAQILDIEVGKTRIDCLFSVSEDSFTGKKKIVLKIKEMKKSNNTTNA